MKNLRISYLMLFLLSSVSIMNCSSKNEEEERQIEIPNDADKIVFHSNGNTFSPVIVLQAPATVTWTWADLTTSTSTTPTKYYGSAQIRKNSLKVTPWSALRRINIGYDALDGGSQEIELVADQQVSLVENLYLVAPFLKEWCSSYNNLNSLDFSNFISIETIECFRSKSLKNVNLANTPKLRRACFEENRLLNFDISGSPALEDIRAALNNYNAITFPNNTQNIWHICVRDNPQITKTNMFNNLSLFPKIADLFIWNTNQQGSLVIPQTNTTREVYIEASRNQFSSVDFRGSFRAVNFPGIVEMSHNQLTSVDITGCVQIKNLDLRYNKLESQAIDQILQQVDDFQTSNGLIDLRQNQPPTVTGRAIIVRLEQRGWTVRTDPVFSISAQPLKTPATFKLVPHYSGRAFQVLFQQMSDQQVVLKIHDTAGRKKLNQMIHQPLTDLSLPPAPADIYLVRLRTNRGIKTQKLLL